jgi:hypothetical protein
VAIEIRRENGPRQGHVVGTGRHWKSGKSMASMLHYTNSDGYKAIGSSPEWLFRTAQPPGDPKAHPVGAYFTDLPEDDPMLANSCGSPGKSSTTSSSSSMKATSAAFPVIGVGTSSILG